MTSNGTNSGPCSKETVNDRILGACEKGCVERVGAKKTENSQGCVNRKTLTEDKNVLQGVCKGGKVLEDMC